LTNPWKDEPRHKEAKDGENSTGKKRRKHLKRVMARGN